MGKAHMILTKPCRKTCREGKAGMGRAEKRCRSLSPTQTSHPELSARMCVGVIQSTQSAAQTPFLPCSGSHGIELGLPPPLMLHEGCDMLPQQSRELEETPPLPRVAA